MPWSQTVICEIATRSDTGNIVTAVDVGALVRSLLLFDKVILKSAGFVELPAIVRAFPKSGLKTLFDQCALQFFSDSFMVLTDSARDGRRDLPWSHFGTGIGRLADNESILRQQFKVLQQVSGLKNEQRAAIEEAVWNSLVHYPSDMDEKLLNQIDIDFKAKSAALKAGIIQQLSLALPNSDLSSYDFDLQINETASRVYRIDTPFAKDFGMNDAQIHEVLNPAVTALKSLDHRLLEMVVFSAMSGFQEKEAPLLFGKLASLIAPQNPSVAEYQFKRVIELADIPDFEPNQRVDVDRLIKIRDSDECRAFRDWLSTSQHLTDAEIQQMTTGIKNRLSSFASSTKGKSVRFAATNGVGLIPIVGPLVGLAASALDTFLVDRVLKQSAILGFLSDAYPSLFIRA